MVGNMSGLSGIVESMFAADKTVNRQNMSNTNTVNFSNYLDAALLNYRSGLLFGNGLGAGYSYLSALSGSTWQSVVVQALKEELKKELESDEENNGEACDKEEIQKITKSKKPDWASIRVIQRYESPMKQEDLPCKGLLV
ncbi:MAG: hypothetical protein J6A75_06035 [Lachnospiraceae bacterium]|nr:hypothetical protein [Lachnospiraceae bacterium]